MQLPKTVHATDARGRTVTREDGTVVLAQAGHQLLFRKNAPVATLVQAPHYADPVYLRRTKIRPPAPPHSEAGRDYGDFTPPPAEPRGDAYHIAAPPAEAAWDEVLDFEDVGDLEDENDD